MLLKSTMLVLGLSGEVITVYTKNLSMSLTWISLAALFGILLNIILNDPSFEKTSNNGNNK